MYKWLMFLVVVLFLAGGCSNEFDIKQQARRSTVQIVFNIPVIKVSFTDPLEDKEKINQVYLQEILDKKDKEIEEKIKKAIEEGKALQAESKYEDFPTVVDGWYKPTSKTMIPIGAVLKRDDIQFLTRVIVACKTEKQDISETEKKYEKDILTISETANVSPTTAKDIITKLRYAGYSINKEEVAKSSDIKLLWFRSGWSTSPSELNWYVKVEGTDNNIIIGYQDGVIETNPIPDDKMVHVYAEYYDMKPGFKEKTNDIKVLETEIEVLKKESETLKETIKQKDKELNKDKKEKKRDISTATLLDVIMGTVKLEEMWMLSHGTGVYLGEIQARSEFLGSMLETTHNISKEKAGLVLTNAHVAIMGIVFEVYVSEDKEVMWIVLPAIPSVRHTSESDNFGSPARLLYINYYPVLSWDYDCALMVTASIEAMNENKAILGDSSRVKEGDKVVSVGNPGMLQKFTTEGVVANTSFSILDSIYSSVFLEEIKNKPMFNWMKNSRFWFDAPIGIGGTSGSGVWALSGPESGKVIALHNMGMVSSYSSISAVSKYKEMRLSDFSYGTTYISDFIKVKKDTLIDRSSIKDVSYSISFNEFEKDNSKFLKNLENKYGINVPMAGLNGGIPINFIKMYLEERGINNKDYCWECLSSEHWVK
jgi:hypothetical protein